MSKSTFFLIGTTLIFTLLLSKNSAAESTFETYFLEDCENEDITAILSSSRFEITENYIYNNYTSCTYWVKITPTLKWNKDDYLIFGNSLNNYEDVYAISSDSITYQISIGTDQNYQSKNYIPAIQLDQNYDYILIRIKSFSFLKESFSIAGTHEYFQISNRYLILYMIVCSFLFLLCVYFTILYIKSRRKVFKLYALYIFSTLFAAFFIANFGRYFIWTQLPFSNTYIEGVMSSFMVVTYSLFVIEATHLKSWSSNFTRINLFFLALFPVLVIISFFIQTPSLIGQLNGIMSSIGILFLIVMIIQNLLNKNPNSSYFLIGFVFFLSATILQLLVNTGKLERVFGIEVYIFSGILVEMFVFSFIAIKHIDLHIESVAITKKELDSSLNKIEELSSKIEELKQNLTFSKNSPTFAVDISVNEQLDHPLTAREIEVLNFVIKGLKYADISEALFISTNTLKTHISRIYSKLEISNRIEAMNKLARLMKIE